MCKIVNDKFFHNFRLQNLEIRPSVYNLNYRSTKIYMSCDINYKIYCNVFSNEIGSVICKCNIE